MISRFACFSFLLIWRIILVAGQNGESSNQSDFSHLDVTIITVTVAICIMLGIIIILVCRRAEDNEEPKEMTTLRPPILDLNNGPTEVSGGPTSVAPTSIQQSFTPIASLPAVNTLAEIELESRPSINSIITIPLSTRASSISPLNGQKQSFEQKDLEDPEGETLENAYVVSLNRRKQRLSPDASKPAN